jgi:hypothetical protein
LLQRRQFNHCILARWIARRKHLTQKRTTQSMSPIIHDCRMSYIDPSAPRLYRYESYFTMHSESMGKQVIASEHSMPMTIYFAICQFSCPDIVFSDLPWMPPKGIITHILLSTLITGIFGIITLCTCFSLTKQKFVAEIRAIRWTDKLIRSNASPLPIHDVLPIPDRSWNDSMRSCIESMASVLRWSLFWGVDFVRFLATGELTLGIARKYYVTLWSQTLPFLREFRKWLHNFFVRETIGLQPCMPSLSLHTQPWRIFRPLILFRRSIRIHLFGCVTTLQRDTFQQQGVIYR